MKKVSFKLSLGFLEKCFIPFYLFYRTGIALVTTVSKISKYTFLQFVMVWGINVLQNNTRHHVLTLAV